MVVAAPPKAKAKAAPVVPMDEPEELSSSSDEDDVVDVAEGVDNDFKLQVMIAKMQDNMNRQHQQTKKILAAQQAAERAASTKHVAAPVLDQQRPEGSARRDLEALVTAFGKQESALPQEASMGSRAYAITAIRQLATASMDGAESMTSRAIEFCEELQSAVANMETAIFSAADAKRRVDADEAVDILHSVGPLLTNFTEEMVEYFARFTILGRQVQCARKLAHGSNDGSFLVQPYAVPEDVTKTTRGVYNIANHTSLPSGGDGWEKSGAGSDVVHRLVLNARDKLTSATSKSSGRDKAGPAAKSTLRCYNCGESGHYAHHCSYPRNERSRSASPPPRHRSRHSHGSASRYDSRSVSRSRSRSASPERKRRGSTGKRPSSAAKRPSSSSRK